MNPGPAREAYRELLNAPAAAAELDQLRYFALGHQVAVMCFEADEERCRRQVLLAELARTPATPTAATPPPPPRWLLRQVVAEHGMCDLVQPLRDRGIGLSTVQIYRLVTKEQVRLNLHVLAAHCDIFDCTADRPHRPAPCPCHLAGRCS